jgi:hypothetical protein
MLGHTWRLRASNTQNQSVTVTVTARRWKFASDGSITWSAEQTLISAASLSSSTGTSASSTVDNSTDKYLGAELTVSMTAGSATNGTGAVTCTIERSTDAGTTWPTQDRGEFVGAYTLVSGDGTNARLTNYRID